MIKLNEAKIRHLVYHTFAKEAGGLYGKNEIEISETEEEIFLNIFLKPFTRNVHTLQFHHEIDLELNPLFKLSQSIYKKEDFVMDASSIHTHLDAVSKHPNIKDGDLFIIQFDNIELGDQLYEGLGIFKVENKENFIETKVGFDDEFELNIKKGIGNRKLDKACLVLFTDEPYTVFVIDNGSNEADYWRNDFIGVGYRKDNVNSTHELMNITKSFITNKFPDEYDVTKADQIDLLNRSVDYFKKNDVFEKGEFENHVFKDPEVIQSFRGFDDHYREDRDLELPESFDISAPVVKRQARVFKSVLKLDKNFHVYIHGNKSLIERGVEQDGRKFYKIYYNEES